MVVASGLIMGKKLVVKVVAKAVQAELNHSPVDAGRVVIFLARKARHVEIIEMDDSSKDAE